MDFNEMPIDSMTGIGAYPFGFMETLAMDERLMTGYNGLTEAQKEDLIFRYRDAESDDARKQLLSMLTSGENRFF